MKTKSFFTVFLLFTGLIACQKETEEAPEVLTRVTSKVQLSLDSLNNVLTSASTVLASAGADSISIRAKLKEIYAATSFVKEASYINNTGILQFVEPSAYYRFQGSDFSTDASVMSIMQSHESQFSTLFSSIEGFDGVSDMHPVYDGTTTYGAVEALFTPSDMLGKIIAPMIDSSEEIWVMEQNGTIIYDPGSTGNGLNVFTDSYFASYTSFITACNTIADNESGQVSYTFNPGGSSTTVATSKAWWTTLIIHHMEWKIVYVEEE